MAPISLDRDDESGLTTDIRGEGRHDGRVITRVALKDLIILFEDHAIGWSRLHAGDGDLGGQPDEKRDHRPDPPSRSAWRVRSGIGRSRPGTSGTSARPVRRRTCGRSSCSSSACAKAPISAPRACLTSQISERNHGSLGSGAEAEADVRVVEALDQHRQRLGGQDRLGHLRGEADRSSVPPANGRCRLAFGLFSTPGVHMPRDLPFLSRTMKFIQ